MHSHTIVQLQKSLLDKLNSYDASPDYPGHILVISKHSKFPLMICTRDVNSESNKHETMDWIGFGVSAYIFKVIVTCSYSFLAHNNFQVNSQKEITHNQITSIHSPRVI